MRADTNIQIITTATTPTESQANNDEEGEKNEQKLVKEIGKSAENNIYTIQTFYTTSNGNNDNIITISTDSINEYNNEILSRERAIVSPLKKQQIFSIKLPQFLNTKTKSEVKKAPSVGRSEEEKAKSRVATEAEQSGRCQRQRQLPREREHERERRRQNAAVNETNSNASTASTASTASATLSKDRFSFINLGCSKWISFQDNIADVQHRRGRRLHGLQLPLHPLQVFGWIVLLLFGIASYYVLIPTFNSTIQGPLYGLITGLYIVHLISHLTALLTDPADKELRRIHRNDRIVPEFDRNKHAHVIENGRCHLCNIKTSSSRTKHCSVCNKCVGKFDHHCKWLNHCIGSRNYVAFLMCVVSAVIATLVIVAAVIAQIVLYYVQPEWLNFWYLKSIDLNHIANDTNATLMLNQTLTIKPLHHEIQLNADNDSDFLNLTTNFLNNTLIYSINNLDYDNNDLNNTLISNNNNLTTIPSLIDNFTTLLNDYYNLSINLKTTTPTSLNLSQTAADSELDSTTPKTSQTATSFKGISLNDTIFLILLGVLGLLAAITAGLLLHLCFFHIYISFLGLTTYEYIRNHRQSQEAKLKLKLNSNQSPTGTLNPTQSQSQNANILNLNQQTDSPINKKTKNCGQIYFCSSLRNPNNIDLIDQNYFNTHSNSSTNRNSNTFNVSESESSDSDPINHQFMKLHCCANSREYHQTALKTYYMCSLLEETTPIANPLANLPNDIHQCEMNAQNFKTFHCCSSFAATTTQRRVSTATSKATLVSADFDASNAAATAAKRSYLQYTEQCTLCTFRIRSPLLSSRKISATSASIRTQSTAAIPNTKPTSAASQVTTSEYKRCCMKSISKHQRWRRKWNCCSAVPDSPDIPNDLIQTLNLHQRSSSTSQAGGHHLTSSDSKKINATDIPVHFIKSLTPPDHNGESNNCDASIHAISPHSIKMKNQVRQRNARTWPVARLRHIVRIFNRYRTRNQANAPDNSHQQNPTTLHPNLTPAASYAEQVKQNQIRPMQMPLNADSLISSQYYQYEKNNFNPKSTTSNANGKALEPQALQTPTTIETILPTSHIGDDTSITYTTPIGIILPPALPPPTRRKIPNPTDLEELAETLGFASHPSNGSLNFTPSQRLPALSNVYRRQRRKHFLRTRSPTLSPIHESGLSNPTSPQPLRHSINTNSSGTTPTTTYNHANGHASNPCSPISINMLNNNSGESGDTMRKTLSTGSLHSITSHSSGTT